MKLEFPRSRWTLPILAGFLIVATLAYVPGLHGGFMLDDATSIVGNDNIHVKDGRLSEWSLAAISFPSGTPPFRSLTMLSFAANYYVGGLDPFGYKLTNLCIHLLNGLLLFFLLRSLFDLHHACSRAGDQPRRFDHGMAAACLAGLWLLLPIQLTAVLYVVQRLEALTTTFVFLGLWWYLHARLRLWRTSGGALGLWASLGVCTVLGILAKEPGIMLPLYAGLIEFAITGGRNRDGRVSRPVLALFGVTLLAPFLVGAAWMWGRYVGLSSVTNPDSFVVRRLMTEAGVLFDYMAWTLFPSLDSLTLHHDDIQLVRGLLDPPSTLAAVIGILGILGLAFLQRRKRPLLSLGILWFFAGHLLTATVVPVVLAFEHRNYFSSAGLLLAVSSAIALEGGLRRTGIRLAAVLVAALLYAATTWMRAEEWSQPMRLVTSDALKRPDSPSAQLDLALGLINQARSTGRADYVDSALRILDSKRKLPGAGIIFEENIISILAPSGYEVPADVWNSIIEKMKHNRAKISDTRSLSQLNHCFITEKCKRKDLPYLSQAYAAAMSHPRPSPTLLSVHAEYAWYLEKDHDQAESDIREAVRLAPRDIAGQKNLIVVLIHQGKRDEAEAMIRSLEAKNIFGTLDGFIEPLRKAMSNTAEPESREDADQ